MIRAARKFATMFLLAAAAFGVVTSDVLADSSQRPRKEPEVVREKNKGDNKDSRKDGGSKDRDDSKKKDDKRKPGY